jgi:hypothetical protein
VPGLRKTLENWLHTQLEELGLSDDFAEPITFKMGLIHEVEMNDEHLLVIPIRIHDSGCRLLIMNRNHDSPRLVPVPIGASHWNCKEMALWSTLDVNGDDVPDFAFVVSIPSNRYYAIVQEGALYLSNPARGDYCYADKLSFSYLGPEVYRSRPKGVKRAIAKEISRLGPQIADCNQIETQSSLPR